MLLVTLLMFLVERLMTSQNSLMFEGLQRIEVPSVKLTHVSLRFEVETLEIRQIVRLLFLLYQMNNVHKAHPSVRIERGLLPSQMLLLIPTHLCMSIRRILYTRTTK
jgi:hypothetical protein